MGYVMVIATPIFTQLMLKSLLSLAIDLSKAIIQFGRGGIVSLWVDYHQSIQQLYLTNRRRQSGGKCGKTDAVLSSCAAVIMDSISHLSVDLQPCSVSFLFYFFIDRWPVTGWRERERESGERKTNGKGAEGRRMSERERDPRASLLTMEVSCSAGFWFKKNKGDFS